MTDEEVNEQDEQADGFASVEDDSQDSEPSVSEPEGTETEEEATEAQTAEASSAEDATSEEADQGEGETDAEKSTETLMDEVQQEMQELEQKPVSHKVFNDTTRRINGKFGEIISRLKKLEGRKPKINPEKLTAMRENFDESYAKDHAEELTQAFEYEESEAQEEITDAMKVQAFSELQKVHPDYAVVARSQEYALWKSSLPADVVDTLDNTWDVEYLTEALTQFKQFRDARAERIEAQKREQMKQEQKAKNTERLRASVPIKTSSETAQGAGLTEADGFASVEIN